MKKPLLSLLILGVVSLNAHLGHAGDARSSAPAPARTLGSTTNSRAKVQNQNAPNASKGSSGKVFLPPNSFQPQTILPPIYLVDNIYTNAFCHKEPATAHWSVSLPGFGLDPEEAHPSEAYPECNNTTDKTRMKDMIKDDDWESCSLGPSAKDVANNPNWSPCVVHLFRYCQPVD